MSSTSNSNSSIIASFVVQFQDTKCNQLLNNNVVIDKDIIINKITFAEPSVDDATVMIDPVDPDTQVQASTIITNILKESIDFNLFIDPETGKEDTSYKFGVIKLKMAEKEKSIEPIDLHAVTDISGSMGEPASSTNVATKGSVMNHVLKNVSSIIAENNESGSKVALCITGFDDKIKKVLPYTSLTFENIINNNKMIDLLLQPRGMTNIKLAMDEFIKEQEKRDAQSLEYGLIEHGLCAVEGDSHKLMITDGSDTCGNINNAVLAGLVDITKSYYFIGLGVGHNSTLLKLMAKPDDCEYHFIPSAEESGPIIATIIHKIYYTTLRKASVTIIGGEIYNYKTNTWTTSLYVGAITSEATRTWHIRTRGDIAEVKVFLRATNDFITLAEDQGFANLNYNILRQRTLEFLYAASHIPTDLNHNPAAKAIFTGKMRDAMNGFFEYLNKYIKSQNLEKCLDHKTLCDDMYIAIQTFGTKLGHLYSDSRGESQETSAAYAITDISAAMPPAPSSNAVYGAQRQNATNGLSLPPAPYKISRQKSSSTPAQRNLMRATSADTGAELDDEDDPVYVYDPIDFGNADPNAYLNIEPALVSTLANATADPVIADMV
jgi:hypothetical protein